MSVPRWTFQQESRSSGPVDREALEALAQEVRAMAEWPSTLEEPEPGWSGASTLVEWADRLDAALGMDFGEST